MNKAVAQGKKALAGFLVPMLMLAGCAKQTVQTSKPLKPGDYPAILPYETSDTRAKHIGLINDIDIRTQLEQGLMEISKDYFSPTDHAFQNHKYLNYDELDASDGSRGLLGTLRDDNPNGLNPGTDEDFDTGNGIVKGPILVVDLYELDFFSGSTLDGIAIGLAVPDAVEDANGNRVAITPEKMQEFLKASGTKIVSYMRERFNDVTPNVPILVAAYQLNTDENDPSKGGYIYAEYFDGTNTTDKTISQQYLLVPSAAFTESQPETAAQFDTFRADVATILSDTTYTTGEAKIENGSVQKLTLTVTAHGKTVGEILAVIQSVREHLSIFESEKCDYKVIIKNNGDICALMDRQPDSQNVQVLTTY